MGINTVAVVIENELTYVSEKLLDALWLGSKVVYVGPSDLPDTIREHPRLIVCEPNAEKVLNAVDQQLHLPATTPHYPRSLLRRHEAHTVFSNLANQIVDVFHSNQNPRRP